MEFSRSFKPHFLEFFSHDTKVWTPIAAKHRYFEEYLYNWQDAVRDDTNAFVIDNVLKRCELSTVTELADVCDTQGRRVMDVAAVMNRDALRTYIYFLGRYAFKSLRPEHKSETCVVMIAEDCETVELVAVKFMKHVDNYMQEKESRKGGRIDDSRYVIPLLASFNAEEDSLFNEELVRKGFGDYKYCIIMPAADRNVQQIVTQEKIAGNDWDSIRKMYGDIVRCVEYLHSKRVIHGDLKPLNVMRGYHGRFLLIDFDASVSQDAVYTSSSSNKGYLGAKVSTGYIPPEMLYIQNISSQIPQSSRPTVSVKSPIEYEKHVRSGSQPPYEPVEASPQTDMWCLGAILYYLCTGETLFLNNASDNVTDNSSLLQLCEWTDATKNEKLLKIPNVLARNLVSRLLSKDPTKRPLTSTGLHMAHNIIKRVETIHFVVLL